MAGEWFSVGYNMMYRLECKSEVDWRKMLSHVSRQARKYITGRCEGQEGAVCCLVADDTDIAKTGMKMEKIGRIYSHTLHSQILGFKGLLFGLTDGKTFLPLDFSLRGEPGKSGTQGLTSKQRKARKTAPRKTAPRRCQTRRVFQKQKSRPA